MGQNNNIGIYVVNSELQKSKFQILKYWFQIKRSEFNIEKNIS